MARVPDVKRIQKEDFEGDMRDAMEKIAYPLNSFMEQTRSALSKSLDFNNLNREVITLEVTVDSSGTPVLTTQFRSNLKTKVIGNTCINAFNLNNTAVYPSNAPFISFIQNENIVTVLNVTGLQAGQKYRLIIESIGQ